MARNKPTKESFLQTKWRPMVAWLYVLICFCDFILFPVLWSAIQTWKDGQVTLPWNPLTLQGAGLLHLSFGAILGIAAHGRSQEKINGAASTVIQPTNVTAYNAPDTSAWSPAGGAGPTAPLVVSRTGKPGPVLNEPERE